MTVAEHPTDDPAVRDDAPVVSTAEIEIDAPIERVFVARLLRRPLQKKLDTALADNARYLKVEAEKAAPTRS